MNSEGGDVGTISNAFHGELFEFKDIVVLVLKLVEVYSVVLNTPCNFLFGFLNLGLISFVKDLEELWINLEVVFGDMKVLSSVGVFLDNLVECFS